MDPAKAQKLKEYIVTYHFIKAKAFLQIVMVEKRPESIYNLYKKRFGISFYHHQIA